MTGWIIKNALSENIRATTVREQNVRLAKARDMLFHPKNQSLAVMRLLYRPDIDGLRAIAVLAVVFYHAFPSIFPGGFIGVDVFFVISGFLISGIIFQQVSEGKFCWTDFYIKRINRLLPALILILFAALIGGYFLLLADEYRQVSRHIFGSSLFINNILLWQEAGYFDVASDFKPLLHLWSLGIEEQFYFIWPVLIYFIWRSKIKVLPVILSVIGVSFLINILIIAHHSTSVFYLPVTRFWELALGASIAWFCLFSPQSQKQMQATSLGLELLAILSLSVLILSIFFLNNQFHYPGWVALLPTLSTAVLLSTSLSWVNRRLLTLSVVTLTGLISYPLYLWHWELLAFVRIIVSGNVSSSLTGCMVALSFLLAWLTWRFIETPIRFSVKSKQQAPFYAKVLIGFLLTAGALGFYVYQAQGIESRVIVQQRKVQAHDLSDFEHYRKDTQPCELTGQQAKYLSWCQQTRSGKPEKVIWGDSHADHLFPGVISQDAKVNWLLLGRTSCPPLLDVKSYWIGEADTCVKANQIALDYILANPSINTVVLASLGPFYINQTGYAVEHTGQSDPNRFVLQSNQADKTGQSKAGVFFAGLERTVLQLRKAGKAIVLFQDVPELPFMPNRCIHRPLAPRMPCFVTQKDVDARQQIYAGILLRLKTKYPEIMLFQPLDYLCKKGICTLHRNNHLLYRDSHHLSQNGSDFIGKQFVHWQKSLISP